MNDTPIVITMGDPSGVGAEVIVKAFAELSPDARARYTVIGDRDTLERARTACDVTLPITDPEGREEGGLSVLHVPVDGLPGKFGVLSEACGEACYQYIKKAVEMTMDGAAAGIVTAPINKAALNAAGHHYDGHTGLLAHLSGSKSSWMLLASPTLNVIHVSTHVSLKDAITERATPDRIYQTIVTGHRHMQRMGIESPRIAVAGINPHCGEGGLFGNEDDLQVTPGVERAQAEGINVVGPIPADTAYYRAHSGDFDLMVAQYHDQGHIPVKLIAFDTAINCSLGLPIDRCSVDHGTAFDLAGTGRAKHVNMLAALDYGRKLAASRG
ncbi:4-hydroxythreonine-4-phosphate dehydrogenase PdxA [Tropicimonas isoalkanivorans]|uniref:4-hydroxythreonine-4-phosphate dehydrogenase n=1 Tax=Tropicimonas isoalkanivorans TaxID=441112 RepID=A0A1I1HPD5_9RHOB|nr:4-hydroxythreonine-4-phosphate dehydrogenase PdxA [Tropicimonas isoalkanivorans]SFC25967.1 4-hydroxythreonine-4-phosphate dehydrogenase [Tropicimonas isoalkanivorans]